MNENPKRTNKSDNPFWLHAFCLVAMVALLGVVSYPLKTLLIAAPAAGPSVAYVLSLLLGSGVQWVAALGLYVSLLSLVAYLNSVDGLCFWRVANPDVWMAGFMSVAVLRYFWEYSTASRSFALVILLVGLLLAKFVALWIRRGRPCGRVAMLILAQVSVCAIGALPIAREHEWAEFYFLGVRRWTGFWGDPNTLGLSSGVGVVLMIGFAFELLRNPTRIKPSIHALGLLGSAALTFWLLQALTKTFSRGAALALLIVGLITACLGWRQQGEWFSWLAALPRFTRVLLVLIGILFPTLLLSGGAPRLWQQRADTVLDSSDRSWRNRVIAWVGAVQIMTDHPWHGVGWNRAAVVFKEKNLGADKSGARAILNNDILLTGVTLGIPALGLFCGYLFFSVFPLRTTTHLDSVFPLACRLAAMLMVVGLWFDNLDRRGHAKARSGRWINESAGLG